MRLKILLNLGRNPKHAKEMLPPYKEGQIVEVEEEQGKKLIALKVAEEYSEEKERKEAEENAARMKALEPSVQPLKEAAAARRNILGGPVGPPDVNPSLETPVSEPGHPPKTKSR